MINFKIKTAEYTNISTKKNFVIKYTYKNAFFILFWITKEIYMYESERHVLNFYLTEKEAKYNMLKNSKYITEHTICIITQGLRTTSKIQNYIPKFTSDMIYKKNIIKKIKKNTLLKIIIIIILNILFCVFFNFISCDVYSMFAPVFKPNKSTSSSIGRIVDIFLPHGDIKHVLINKGMQNLQGSIPHKNLGIIKEKNKYTDILSVTRETTNRVNRIKPLDLIKFILVIQRMLYR